MFKKSVLDNGIRVVTENIPHVRSVSLGVWVMTGGRGEPPVLKGASHFIEHMLFKGTKTRSAKDIAITMDSIGGELNAFTSKEGTTYYVKVLDEHLPIAVELLSDILLNSVFDPKELERERKVIIEEIKMVEDTPDDLVHDIYVDAVWKGNSLGQPILGTKGSIRAMSRDALLGHMKKSYLPGEIVVSAAGNFKMGALMRLLNKGLGGYRRAGRLGGNPKPSFVPGVTVKERKLEQAHLCMGYEGLAFPDEERFAVYALSTLMGSSMSSRLFQEIREKRGLAYSVYSYLTQLSDAGLFTVYAAVSPQKAAQLVRLIRREVEKLIKDGVDDDELGKVKEQMKGNMVLGMENTNTRMSQLAKHEIYLGRHYSLDDMLRQIDAVDTGRIRGLIDRLFVRGRPALVALGPVSRAELKTALFS